MFSSEKWTLLKEINEVYQSDVLHLSKQKNDVHKVFESLYFLAELCWGVLVLENSDCFLIQGSWIMQLFPQKKQQLGTEPHSKLPIAHRPNLASADLWHFPSSQRCPP